MSVGIELRGAKVVPDELTFLETFDSAFKNAPPGVIEDEPLSECVATTIQDSFDDGCKGEEVTKKTLIEKTREMISKYDDNTRDGLFDERKLLLILGTGLVAYKLGKQAQKLYRDVQTRGDA